jgi:deoxyhypusine synthase
VIYEHWQQAQMNDEHYFPHEYLYQILLSGALRASYQIDEKDSWLLAAAEKNLPIVVPGWEDSTLGNIFSSYCYDDKLKPQIVRSGIEYMVELARWYEANAPSEGVGFFQIGGGIAGDFPICVVPMLHQDLGKQEVPVWSYFCQISDSTTSFGSYSGAVPNEKITWGKLAPDTPKFIVESDASIVAPLIFAKVLSW